MRVQLESCGSKGPDIIEHHRHRGPSSNPNQTLPKPSSPSQVESNTTPVLLLLECLCGALLPTTPVSGTAPPNSLSKPLLQNRRGVISNASIEEIEAEKSLIEEDAHKYAQYLVAALVSKTLPLLILPRNLISSCTKKRSNRLVSSWPFLDTFIWYMKYDESFTMFVAQLCGDFALPLVVHFIF
nr:uncharacterized protein LOC118062289 [Populus alba]